MYLHARDIPFKSIELPFVRMWLDDNIFYAVYAPDTEIDLHKAKEAVAARVKLCEAKSYPCLIDIRGLKSMSKEAREYLANEGAKYITALALITGNAFTRTFAQLFLIINNPFIPVRLFDDPQSAKQWLKSFVPDKDTSVITET
jgi:hypothetical protein